MRPKKRMLLLEEDETRLGMRAFVLETRLLVEVVRCRNTAELLWQLCAAGPGTYEALAVVAPAPAFGPRVLEEVRRRDAYLRVLAVGFGPATEYADVWLPAEVSSAELVERVRVALARKSGPKPAAKKPVGSVRGGEKARQVA